MLQRVFLFDIILLMEEVLDRKAWRDYQNNAIKIFKFGLSVILIYLLAFGFMLFAMQMRSGLEGFLGMLVLIGCFLGGGGVVVSFIYTSFENIIVEKQDIFLGTARKFSCRFRRAVRAGVGYIRYRLLRRGVGFHF